VLEYQQTSMVWIRGWLEHEFGIAARDIEWHMERAPERSHGGATGFRPGEGVRLSYIPPEKSMGAMMLARELDVLPFYPPLVRDLVDRGTVDLSGRREVRPLFVDPVAEARRYLAKTNIFPINHGVVIRRAIAERHPELVRDVFDTFVRANAYGAQRRASLLAPATEVGTVGATLAHDLRADPLAYGLKANRPTLDALFTYIFEQGLSSRRVAIDEIFAPGILDT
jgi:4,5-dihydroxyphthalate decarboxylase